MSFSVLSGQTRPVVRKGQAEFECGAVIGIVERMQSEIEVSPNNPSSLTHRSLAHGVSAVVKEILFVAAILLGHIFNLILSYSRNLKLMVDNENRALTAVANGDLSTYVTVGANDEFGIMARYTNLMIHRLDESRRHLEQAQRRLVDVERLRAIGELASMIAHEIRSPLNVMQMTLAYFAKQELARISHRGLLSWGNS